MIDPATIAAIRFGYGFHPAESPPATPADLIASLPRSVPRPRLSYAGRAALMIAYRDARRAGDEARIMAAQRALRDTGEDDLRHVIARAVDGPGFAERLVHFWTDHFTIVAASRPLALGLPDFIDTAVRPHVAGRFPDMLRAAIFHPAMLVYLDQAESVGPNSIVGQRRGRGLNENLAREVLELHTLGVAGPYSQRDVRELARLLTGLSADRNGFRFRNRIAEPGTMSFLGKTYTRSRPGSEEIETALEDIALHPASARHIAKKLIVHFIGVDPDADWIDRIVLAYLDSGGDLPTTYAAVLSDDRAWSGPFTKAKTPLDFIVSAFRAGGATGRDVEGINRRDLRQGVAGAMAMMGQPPFRPPGPDGWPEEPEAWITPPTLAARIRWATAFAERALGDLDPREFLETALRDASSELLRVAVAGSESQIEGLALTLASPEFNRR